MLRADPIHWTIRIQALLNSLGDEVKGKVLGLGGDGRYYNKEAAQIILKLVAAAGVKKVGSNSSGCHLLMTCQECTLCRAILATTIMSWTVQVFVGQDAIFATPAMSALIRRRNLYGVASYCYYNKI
jgi:phosphoglucomutase